MSSIRAPAAPAWQPWAAVGGFTLLLHFAWEMMQVPLYQGMAGQEHWPAVLRCARATVGDAAISLAAYGAAAIRVQDRLWLRRPSRAPLLVFLATGLLMTVILEWLNVRQWARWSYSPRMPTLVGIGSSPLLQWTLLPPLTLWLARRHLGLRSPDIVGH